MKKSITNIFLVLLLFTLSTCKKYPENTLWFKNPEKVPVLKGYITKYEVNGIDSLDLLNKYFGVNPTIKNRNVKECEFQQYINYGRISGIWNLGGSCTIETDQHFLDKGKKIRLFQSIDTSCYKKNIFVSLYQVWEILHFPTSKKPYFKIKTLVNNNTIIIQFN